MKKIYRVSYVLSGITERTDDFATMDDNSFESAVNAIREKFNGVWGFDPDAIEIKSTVCGHYEYRKSGTSLDRLPCFKGSKTFVAD